MSVSDITYIATISGGKDSVTMCDLLLKNNYPVDYIVFYDTFFEFPIMYEYLEKLKNYFKDRYKKEIIVTKPKTTFEEWCFGVIDDKNALYNGAIRGIPMVWSEPCYWRREAKVKPYEEFIKINNLQNVKVYVGFTLDEVARKNKDKNMIYPLIDTFNMREMDCIKYLQEQEMENPLYRFFTRTGCGFCPAQSKKAWYEVYKNFKETWEYMKSIEQRLIQYQSLGFKVKNCYWFPDFKTIGQVEIDFRLKERQGKLFDFSDEPLKDCFCKV